MKNIETLKLLKKCSLFHTPNPQNVNQSSKTKQKPRKGVKFNTKIPKFNLNYTPANEKKTLEHKLESTQKAN